MTDISNSYATNPPNFGETTSSDVDFTTTFPLSSSDYTNLGSFQTRHTPVASIFNTVNNKTYNFPFNINSHDWTYQINTQSYDTYGGRVTQILSAMATTMSLNGEAGSRKNLLDLYTVFKNIQDDQNNYKKPMRLNVPSRNLSYVVYLEQMSIAWDVTTVTYPYAMSFEIQRDLSATKTPVQTAVTAALERISDGIGYNPTWNGMNKTEVSIRYNDVKNFAEILKSYGINP